MSHRRPFAGFRKQGSSLLLQFLDHKSSPSLIFSSYRKLKQNRKIFNLFSPTGFVSSRSLNKAAFSDLTFSFPLLKETTAPTGPSGTDKTSISYQNKTFPSEIYIVIVLARQSIQFTATSFSHTMFLFQSSLVS